MIWDSVLALILSSAPADVPDDGPPPGNAAVPAVAAVAQSADDTGENQADEPPEPSGPLDLGGGWTVDVGGQLRYRYMDETNKTLTGVSPRHNDFHLWRTRVHGDFQHVDGLRVFVEGIDARIHGEERAALPIDRNDLDVLNGFAEWDAGMSIFRVGRTELLEGEQRLVSPLDWGNTRRTFDGGMARVEHGEDSRTDVFVTRPVVVNVHDGDDPDRSRWFSGIYHTTEGEGTWDLFGLALNESDDVVLGDDGNRGEMDLYTVGGRWADTWDDVDYELWVAKQFGQRAGDRIRAHAWSARVGRTFPDVDGSPRIGLDVDYATGDSNPGDGTLETFNQLFPLGHAYFGYLDLVGRQNILAVSPNATIGLGQDTKLRGAWHSFRLAEREDALYNAGGAATFADPTGSSSRDVGSELDLTLTHVPDWRDRSSTILLGWSRFFAGNHVDDLGGHGNAELFYLQLTLTF